MTDWRVFTAVGLLALAALDALAAAARSALLNVSLARLLAQRERAEARVNRILAMTHPLEQARAGLELAQLLFRVLIAGLVLLVVAPPVWTAFTLLAALGAELGAALALFWLEWLAEEAAARAPERWALRLVGYIRFWMAALAPFLLLPLAFTRRADADADVSANITEDDLKTIVDASQEEGVLEKDEREMIYSIFRLGDTLAREIMVPRIDVFALEANTPLKQAVEALLKAGHSRIPVYEETIDNILGLLYARDLLQVEMNEEPVKSLREYLRPAYFVPEAKKVDELLAEMQTGRFHMAIVVDEYGGVAGIVTLEDIVEEIVGEIQDEYDSAEESPFQIVGQGEYIFQGRIDLGDFNEIMGSQLQDEEADTLSGYVYSHLGRVPAGGETVPADGLILTVEQVLGRRIRKVRARRELAEGEKPEEESNAER